MSANPNEETDKQLGFALLRVMLGVNMLGRSLVRLPDMNGFASGMANNFSETILPEPFVYVYAFMILFIEAIVGIMLIIGWKTRWALVGMGALLISLTFGQILLQSFGTVANILIYAIAVTLLLFYTKYDFYGIDRGFSPKK